ncbi:class A sortase [Wansuia hejianensis]|uniref:Class A sortase n=1 Tax=Wansuia hejianensis TaxID=2763667 RepID=A0A926EXK8_9FIRM|nr:class A sortase [Wansuia hejianensis]MBC8590198.1 class A sortase [Wansuia hejianensis]
MKRIISLVLIIIGILLILTPITSEQIIKYYGKNLIDNGTHNEELKFNNSREIEAEFDYSAIDDVDIMAILRGSMNFNKELAIGLLLIPDLDMELPIMNGLSNSNLMVGASTMKPDQSFGKGNFTLAGHYMKNKDLLFGNLMDIEIGTIVYVSNGENIYEYEIYDRVLVPDTEIEMLSDERSKEVGKPIISLMTCYFSSDSGKRFFALGELVDEYPVE